MVNSETTEPSQDSPSDDPPGLALSTELSSALSVRAGSGLTTGEARKEAGSDPCLRFLVTTIGFGLGGRAVNYCYVRATNRVSASCSRPRWEADANPGRHATHPRGWRRRPGRHRRAQPNTGRRVGPRLPSRAQTGGRGPGSPGGPRRWAMGRACPAAPRRRRATQTSRRTLRLGDPDFQTNAAAGRRSAARAGRPLAGLTAQHKGGRPCG